LGSLVALAILIFAVFLGFLVPKQKVEFPPRDRWLDEWEEEVKAGAGGNTAQKRMNTWRQWLPYVISGAVLLVRRLDFSSLIP